MRNDLIEIKTKKKKKKTPKELFSTQHHCFNQLQAAATKLFTTIPKAMITGKTAPRRFRVKGRWVIEA